MPDAESGTDVSAAALVSSANAVGGEGLVTDRLRTHRLSPPANYCDRTERAARLCERRVSRVRESVCILTGDRKIGRAHV